MPLTDNVPKPELVSAAVPVTWTPALPPLALTDASFEVPVMATAPLPELLSAPEKSVPTELAVPFVELESPATVKLPPVTETVLVELKAAPVPVAEVPESDVLPENVRFAPEKTSRPLEELLTPFRDRSPAPEFVSVSVPRSWMPALDVDDVPFTVRRTLRSTGRRPAGIIEAM